MGSRICWNLSRAFGVATALGLGASAAAAQETGTIRGRVVDAASQRPLIGAQVVVEGTGAGTATNDAGAFLLPNIAAGERIVRVVMLGYTETEQTVNVVAGQTITLDFELSPSVIALDEVVVTGQGQAVERRQLSTTVDVISAEEIEAVPVTSVDQLLQGRLGGATVNLVSAQPGTAGLINFRGVTSVFSAQTPVIYVDGVRVDNAMMTSGDTGGEQSSALAELLTNDIERIEVIKGGAASTLYGSDAATGVIQVFTKKGLPGAPRVTFRIEQGVDVPELKYMFDTKLSFPDLVEAREVPPDFLRQNFFKNGYHQNYAANVSGGSADLTYNVSGRIQNGTGVQPDNENSLFSLRSGIRATLGERLVLDFSGSFTRSAFGRIYNGTAIADPLTSFEVGDALFFSSSSTLDEALEKFLMADIDEDVNRFIFGTTATYDASEYLSTRLSVGIDYRSNHQRQLHPIGFTPGEDTGQITRWDRTFNSVTLDFASTFAYPNSGPVTSSFTFGAQGFRDNEDFATSTGTTFALPGAPEVDEAAIISAAEGSSQVFNGGFFFQERLGLWERLFFEAGLRLDYNSTFGDDFGLEAYPKLGGSYIVSDEAWWQDALGGVVDEMKLRAAYGQAGKFPSPFVKDRTFSATPFRGESAPGFDNPGNEELGPEVTATLEFGFDAALLSDRIGVSFTYFDAVTHDALLNVPEPPPTGQGTQLRNIGEVTNKGIELGVNALILNSIDYTWSVGATFQTVENEVTEMGTAAPFFVEAQKHVCGPPYDCGLGEGVGRPVGAWYVTTPVDTNGDGKLDSSERRYTGGQPFPTRSGSITTSLTLFDRLTLGALADWATGHQVMDWGSVWASFNGIYRREEIEGVEFPIRHDLDGNPILNDAGEPVRFSESAARSAFLYDGDYLKLREISARYAVPASLSQRLGLSNTSVYASVRNVAIFSKTKLIDPELNGLSGDGLALGGESSVTLSPPRQFRFGIEVSF